MDTPVITPAATTAPAQKKGFGDILGSALGGFARGAGGALSVLSPPAAEPHRSPSAPTRISWRCSPSPGS